MGPSLSEAVSADPTVPVMISSDSDSNDHVVLPSVIRAGSSWPYLMGAKFVAISVLNCILAVLVALAFSDLLSVMRKNEAERLFSLATGASDAPDVDTPLKDAPYCLPCDSVYLTSIEVRQNRFKVKVRSVKELNRTVELCCAESHDDLATLVGEMFVRVAYSSNRKQATKNVTEEAEGNTWPIVEPHLLLELDPSQRAIEMDGMHNVPLRRHRRSSMEPHRQSATFQNGAITISVRGHYYIYSFVSFNFKAPSDRPGFAPTQSVYRVRNGMETQLLENSALPCALGTDNCLTSFAGGTFLLEEKDTVVLRVSDYSYINSEKETNLGLQVL